MNSSTELEDVLPTIIDSAKEYLSVERVSVFLLDGGILKMSAHAGFTPKSEVMHKLGEGITGRVAKTGKPYIMNSKTLKASQISSNEYSASSFMSLPLFSGRDIIGVLNLTDKKGDFFSDEDISIASFLAAQCALAVERNRLYLEMKGAERIKAIGVLRASIAHDIRNLLGIVEVYLSLMQAGDMESLNDYINAIRQEILRVQGLTEDIMLYTKEHIDLNINPFNLCELIAEIAKQYNLSLKHTESRVVSIARQDFNIIGDRDRLFRVFFNLVHNAVQAVNEAGIVTVHVKKLMKTKRAVISIFDNGKGIAKSQQSAIFDPFVTSGKAYGTGLGLAIVREIIRAHNGSIRLRSVEGRYTVFQIILPAE
ncbi:MAG: GAF domain-containing sensor histidine kinase [Deferribacteraceae bacterium]|jgi:signal transduction histidine kinase|nr:GAF domain-containing sensor histidine kinase [Deferribacteraceae bacterium]